jgi:hypothetical protein
MEMKRFLFVFATAVVFLSLYSVPSRAESGVLDLTPYQDVARVEPDQREIVTVKLMGKINHSGYPDYHATVTGVSVWIAEFPNSKNLKVISDGKGWWTMLIEKYKGMDIGVSLIYEKKGWITTKSNVITVSDEDNTDLAIQYIDPILFRLLIKPLIQQMMGGILPPGADPTFRNAIVATVGKSWASIHDDRLPHGDPGATVAPIPFAIGPLYFDENVRPNPAYSKTSVDGGVAWLNVPEGTYVISATKEGVTYHEIKFVVDAADDAAGVMLYIASPPDSIQGTNDSAPGEF